MLSFPPLGFAHMNARYFRPRTPGSRGFTLLELMVVVLIISILLAVGGAYLTNPGGGNATKAASRELRGVFEQAHSRALASGNQTAVLISKKWDATGNNDRYLRFALIVEKSPTDGNWTPIGNGTYLTSGVYYWPNPGGGTAAFNQAFADNGNLNLGGLFTGYTKSDWIGLIFTAQGMPVGPGPLSTNPMFLVAAGLPSSSGLEVTGKDKLLTEGFMIQRSNGRIIAIENPADQLSL